ncbi:MAG: GC-type dockerin domain-anchored protein [Planctomycetota bacterium]
MAPRSAITIAATAGLAAAAHAQVDRQVQIRSVDFGTGVIELFNFAATDVDLSGWRFCSHDFNEARRYSGSGGLNGVTIEAGTSVFIHFDDDAPAGDPDRLDRASLGGAFAGPLDQDAYALEIFTPGPDGVVSFGSTTDIVDHVQWNLAGGDVGSAQTRSAQAVTAGLWTAASDFVITTDDSERIDLIDDTGAELHGPADYDVAEGVCRADFDGDGELTIFDFLGFQNAFDAGDLAADFDGDGALTIFDFLAFQNEFDAGCP